MDQLIILLNLLQLKILTRNIIRKKGSQFHVEMNVQCVNKILNDKLMTFHIYFTMWWKIKVKDLLYNTSRIYINAVRRCMHKSM